MIKKINKLIDDMPFIIKLILGIIMTGIITLCFFIIGVVQVDAAAIDYNSGANYIHKYFPTAEFIQFGRGVDFTLNSAYAYDKVNIQWTNYQAGVADIAIVLKLVSGTLATYNCNDIYHMFSVVESGQDTGATYRRKECRISGNEINLKLYWRTTLKGGASNYMEVQLNKQFTSATVVNAYGVMTINTIDPATNTDIQNQTNALINNNNTNTEILYNQLMHQSEWEEEDDEVKNGLLRNIISGIGNIFGFLGDDELDDPDDSLSDLSSNMGTNNVISSLLLLPVSIYQSVVNNINGTCNSFNLGSLYNHNLTMTCIKPQDYLGSALWGVIDVIISGIFVLHIRKKFVDIFNHFTSLRTGGNELE